MEIEEKRTPAYKESNSMVADRAALWTFFEGSILVKPSRDLVVSLPWTSPQPSPWLHVDKDVPWIRH